jgi:hypothetical protein
VLKIHIYRSVFYSFAWFALSSARFTPDCIHIYMSRFLFSARTVRFCRLSFRSVTGWRVVSVLAPLFVGFLPVGGFIFLFLSWA